MIRKFICMMALAAISLSPYAQERLEGQKGSVVGIKTNLPYWGALGTFNAGVEFRLARHWSLDIESGLNPFSGKNDDGFGGALRQRKNHNHQFDFPILGCVEGLRYDWRL